MAAAVDTESGHFFDAVCFRLEQPRRCASAIFLGSAMDIAFGVGAAGLFCRRRGVGRAGHGAALVATKTLGPKSRARQCAARHFGNAFHADCN